MEALPSGVVTFLLTDVEGSTGLWERDEAGMDAELARHDSIVRAAIAAHGGHVFSTAGDSFAAAFTTPMEGLSAAVAAQRALGEIGLRVRMAVHSGEAHERDGDYFGPTVNRAARLMAAAHGGQVVVSNAVAELLRDRAQFRDLGEHRLRDMTSSARIWQVVASGLVEEFPPLRTLHDTQSNLPVQRTSLVGRDDEVRALVAALDEARIVTVTGVGGIGKTRLALHAASEAAPGFPGGVWLALLANVDSSEAVGDVVLAAVGGRRQAERSPLSSLAELATARRMLVLLDNCEHVLVAAAECAEAIVAGGTSVVLGTSREPLGLAGEQVIPVPSLVSDAAGTLFAQRARAVDPVFVVGDHNRVAVAEICRRLDGMPLALELAAARVRSMTVQEIAQRLDARFRLLRGGVQGVVERHRTLQAAMQWSYDLLDRREQRLFAELSVFAGGFTVDAVAAVCGDEAMDDVDAADVLGLLVSRSIVVADRTHTTSRYSLLETLRQFGEDALHDTGETAARRARHAQYMLTLAESARNQMSTVSAAEAANVFDSEWDNLRVAFEWFASHGDIDGTLRLVVACQWFATLSSRNELLQWAERAIALDDARGHELWPAAAGCTAILRVGAGDAAGGETLAIEAIRAEEIHHYPPRFEPATALLVSYWDSMQTERAIQVLGTVERIATNDHDPLEIGQARYLRALAYLVTDLAGAGSFADDAVHEAQASGNPHQLAFAYTCVLIMAAGHHDLDQARDAFTQARQWAESVNSQLVLTHIPLFLAMASREDEPLEALSLVRDVIAGSIITGQWANLDFALRRIILPLVRLGRC